MNKRNYRQAKRQKEDARKTRQQQKQQRRSDRSTAADGTLEMEPSTNRQADAPDPAPET